MNRTVHKVLFALTEKKNKYTKDTNVNNQIKYVFNYDNYDT